jgi:hypothetical protein
MKKELKKDQAMNRQVSIMVASQQLHIDRRAAAALMKREEATLKQDKWMLESCEVYQRINMAITALDYYCKEVDPNHAACSTTFNVTSLLTLYPTQIAPSFEKPAPSDE